MRTVNITGFPSPAHDYREDRLSIDGYLIRNPATTFFFQVTGDEFKKYGLHDGDMLVVDSSVSPQPDHIVIALICGGHVVCRISERDGHPVIETSDSAEPIELGDLSLYTTDSDMPRVLGVVIGRYKRIAYFGACD